MIHPFQSHLDEYQYAINHLAPTVPFAIKEAAQKMHDVLLANSSVTDEEIDAALYQTGIAEYPHRHAFKEMTARDVESRRVEIVLEHVEPEVALKVKKMIDSQVTINELVKSQLFETDFIAEERHQIEDALLDADIHIKEEFGKEAAADSEKYDALLKKWEGIRDQIVTKITELDRLKSRDEKWREEIEGKVQHLQEGFLVTEPDVTLDEVEHEIEYWKGTFGDEV